jgi:hypothetical protein
MTANKYVTTNDHRLAFGSIIESFARFERLVELVISNALGTDIGMATIAISGLGFSAKCDTAIALITVKCTGNDSKNAEEITRFIREFNEFIGLRNHIAHRVWKPGRKPNTIKPLGLIVRGKLKGYGLSNNDIEYTVKDLIDTANNLIKIYDDFKDFLVSCNITPVIAEKTEDTSAGLNKSPDSPEK